MANWIRKLLALDDDRDARAIEFIDELLKW